MYETVHCTGAEINVFALCASCIHRMPLWNTAPQHGYRSGHFINFFKPSESRNRSIFSKECLNTLRGEEMGSIPVCRSQAEPIFSDTATLQTGNVQLWISLKSGSQTLPPFKSCPKWNPKVLSQMTHFMFTCRLVDLQWVPHACVH